MRSKFPLLFIFALPFSELLSRWSDEDVVDLDGLGHLKDVPDVLGHVLRGQSVGNGAVDGLGLVPVPAVH